MWTEKFQIFKLDLEKAKEPEIKLDHRKSKKIPQKLLLHSLHWSPWLCESQQIWKVLKEMRVPDHLTCLLINCMQVKKQQCELDVEQLIGSKLGNDYVKAICCHPAYLTSMQSTLCESWAGIIPNWNQDWLPGERSITSDMQIISL